MEQPSQPSPVETKPGEAKPEQTNPEQSKPVKKKSNAALIIIIVVVALLILGVGGYFAWKYLGQKLVNRITGKTADITTDTSTGKVKLQSVLDALMYPGSKITDQKQGEESLVYTAELTLSSADSVDTIKNYYVKLTNDNKWKITRQGTSNENNFYLTIVSPDFTAEIDVTRYDGYDTTDIRIGISGDRLASDGISISTTSTSGTTSTSTGSGTTSTGTSSTGTTGTTGTTQSGSDYVISDSNTREISRSELTGFTPWQLKVARNEIYARHGRPFVHKDLQCYFAKKTWYEVDNNYDVSSVTYIENKNIATIQAYEQETSSPLMSSDSGCDTKY